MNQRSLVQEEKKDLFTNRALFAENMSVGIFPT